jgi:Anion-transporting ATPase
VDDLIGRRVAVVLGKGGVGRTSVSFALSLLASQGGQRTLIIETDPERPIAAAYDRRPGLEPVELARNLWALFLGGRESLEDYLGLVVPRAILRAVFASSLYQYFVSAAPGLRELTMMGKVFHEIERRPHSSPPWNLIVLDLPASGQALSMLKMPFAARETFGESIVGSEARAVAAFFRDRAKCAMITVTTAEALPISETLEIHHALEALRLGVAAVIFNRTAARGFEAGDITRMLRRATRAAVLRRPGDLAEIARNELRRRNHERRALAILKRQIGAPIVALSERRGLSGLQLASELAAQLNSDCDVRGSEASSGAPS